MGSSSKTNSFKPLLSGRRFQSATYNLETQKFSGTGGGTYNVNDGNYTEHIEFFSRDATRVVRSLVFNYMVEKTNGFIVDLAVNETLSQKS